MRTFPLILDTAQNKVSKVIL